MTRHEIDDDGIRAAFRRLRTGDERSAPTFQQIVAARAADGYYSASRFTRRAPIALAAAAAILLAVGAVVIGPRERVTVPDEVIALSAWRPASDVLLEFPGRRVLTHAPPLGASLIDINLGGIPR
jgi:hypothetical protein